MRYSTGTITNVINVEAINPPMTAIDMGAETKLDCPASPSAGGIMAPMVAAAVMIIGRTRFWAPAIIAWSRFESRRRYWMFMSNHTHELDTTIPYRLRMPIKMAVPK